MWVVLKSADNADTANYSCMETIKMTQTTRTQVIKSQATAISNETQRNQIMQSQQLMGIAIPWAMSRWARVRLVTNGIGFFLAFFRITTQLQYDSEPVVDGPINIVLLITCVRVCITTIISGVRVVCVLGDDCYRRVCHIWSNVTKNVRGEYFTRGNCNKLLQTDVDRYELRKNFFSNCIVNMWNSLPDYVVMSDSINTFKNRLDAHWKHIDFLFHYRATYTGTGD